MKLWGHIIAIVAAMAVVSTTLVTILIATLEGGLQPAEALALVLAAMGLAGTEVTGGVLLKRFYDHHREHAERISSCFDQLQLEFPNRAFEEPEAVRVFRARSWASPPDSADILDRALEDAMQHLRWVWEYRGARKAAIALRVAVAEYERGYKAGRGLVVGAAVEAISNGVPDLPKVRDAYPGRSSWVDGEAVGGGLWMRLCATARERDMFNVGKVWGGNAENGAREYQNVSVQGYQPNVAEIPRDHPALPFISECVGKLAARPDLREAAAGVLALQARVTAAFGELERALIPIVARSRTNREIAGWCDNCPRLLG